MQEIDGTIVRRIPIRLFNRYASATLIIVFSVMLLTTDSFAQGSDLEKTVTKKTTSAKKKSSPKSSPAKKSGSPQTSPVRRSSTRRSSSKRSASPRQISFSFNTPAPNQQIWLGEKMLGVSNEDSVLEKSIKPGNYLVSVRDIEGNVVLKSQLIKVDADSKSATLTPDQDTNFDAADKAAEEELTDRSSETLEASEKVLSIMRNYADPVTTNTISLSDWQYVLDFAKANTINSFTAGQIEAQLWFASGQIELARGKYSEALTSFGKAKIWMPGSAYPDYAAGETYLANGQADNALQSYSNAIGVDPKFSLAHAKMGDIYARTNRPKEAAVSYRLAIDSGFDSSAIKFALAKELMKNKRWEEASQYLEEVLKDAPAGDVYITLGDLYKELKRPISTYEAYRRAAELLPMSSIAFYKLGELLFDEREYDKAKIAMEKAMALDEKGEKINLGLARKYIREAEQKLR